MAMFLTLATISSFILWILLLIIATYAALYYIIYFRQTRRWKQFNIPFLQPSFLIGHKSFFHATKYSVSVCLDQIYKESQDKELIGFFLGVMPMILLKDYKLMRQIVVKNSSRTFETGFATPENEVESQFMINLTQNESRWKFGRNTLMPVFSVNSYRGSKFKTIEKTIHEMWDNTKKNEKEGIPLNVQEITENIILNILSSNFFGIDSKSKAMKQNLRTIMKDIVDPTYRNVIKAFFITNFPSIQIFKFFTIIPRSSCSAMSEILKNQINQRDERNTETGDFIDILRSLRNNKEPQNSWDKDSDTLSIAEGLTIRQMTGLGLILLLGGIETTTGLLNFVIHALSLHPEYQFKIRRELQEALKKYGVLEPTFEVVQSLHFTFQCLFETARLYPVLPFVTRQCSEDFQIPGTDYTFKKGDKFILPLYSMGRDEEQFQDPHSFNPERFNSNPKDFTIPGMLLSFGIGPRKCPGYQPGMFVAAAIVASLLHKYEIKPRSHLKLMDGKDFAPKGFNTSSRAEILVDLVRCESL